MPDRHRRFHHVLRLALACSLLAVLAACSTDAAPSGGDAPTLAPQASGSFSGGSLRRGSVEGDFSGVGVGSYENTPHVVEMTVSGVLWFECRNNGGSLAPGQFAFTEAAEASLEGHIDRNGRFSTTVSVEGPSVDDSDCKNNWTVNADENGPITFLQVLGEVRAVLYELDGEERIARDTFVWSCDDPEPTGTLEGYVPPDLTGPAGVCTLEVDGSGNDGGGKGNGKGSTG